MSGFASDWLALREPYDLAARSQRLLSELAAWAQARGRLAVVDLGSGTGSNLRGTAPHLPVPQAWTLLENDERLIAEGAPQLGVPGNSVDARYERVDLARDLEQAVVEGTDLITCAAFCDLVSGPWLDRLVAVARQRRAALYIVLTYDGGWRWRPGDVFDGDVKRLFDAHQATDKGFGPALGPAAVDGLKDRLAAEGGRLMAGASDWRLGYDDHAIQTALLEGYAQAAVEMAPQLRQEIEDWQAQRARQIAAGRSEHRVGHQDLLWLPG